MYINLFVLFDIQCNRLLFTYCDSHEYLISLSLLHYYSQLYRIDRDRNGFIDVTEFLVAIKGDMNSKRTALVCRAFELLDTDK